MYMMKVDPHTHRYIYNMLVCLGLVILLMSCNCWEQPWFPQFFPGTDAGESRYPREGHPQCVRADLPCAPRFVDPLFWCRPQLKLWLGLSHFCMASGKISSSRVAPTKGHDWQTISGIGDVIISIHEVGINLVVGTSNGIIHFRTCNHLICVQYV